MTLFEKPWKMIWCRQIWAAVVFDSTQVLKKKYLDLNLEGQSVWLEPEG